MQWIHINCEINSVYVHEINYQMKINWFTANKFDLFHFRFPVADNNMKFQMKQTKFVINLN